MSVHTVNAQVSESFLEMQGMLADRELRVEPRVWGELSWGMYLCDQNGKVWLVIGASQGWVRLLDINGAEISVPPKDPNYPVRVVVLPEDEAVLLLERCLGATPVLPKRADDTFAVARQLLVAERWAVPLMPATGGKPAYNKLRDHLDWFHTNQWTGDIKAVEDLARAHEELHASIGDLPMSKAHHHTANPGGRP